MGCACVVLLASSALTPAQVPYIGVNPVRFSCSRAHFSNMQNSLLLLLDYHHCTAAHSPSLLHMPLFKHTRAVASVQKLQAVRYYIMTCYAGSSTILSKYRLHAESKEIRDLENQGHWGCSVSSGSEDTTTGPEAYISRQREHLTGLDYSAPTV